MRNYHILIDRKHTVNTTINVARLVSIEVIGKSKGGWIILSTTVQLQLYNRNSIERENIVSIAKVCYPNTLCETDNLSLWSQTNPLICYSLSFPLISWKLIFIYSLCCNGPFSGYHKRLAFLFVISKQKWGYYGSCLVVSNSNFIMEPI